MYLAKISLPVPLSPCSNTGTCDVAAISALSSTASAAGELPKSTSSGGNPSFDEENKSADRDAHPIVVLLEQRSSSVVKLDSLFCTCALFEGLSGFHGLFVTSGRWRRVKVLMAAANPARPSNSAQDSNRTT
jgi:hypothetical protein